MAKQSVKDVESTAATSTTSGARSADQILKAADGDQSATDSTVYTSTTAPRSAEEIMKDMDKEKKAKEAAVGTSAASKFKAEMAKWKKSGINARETVDEATDTVEEAKDSVEEAVDTVQNLTGAVEGASTGGSSVLNAMAIGTTIANTITDDKAVQVSEALSSAAPTDEAIAEYQQTVSEAESNGLHVKSLPYTNEQQTHWNAQDQHRMYSNYGNMYEHGANETEYNMAILNSAMASAGVMPTKTLSAAPTLRQKFLSEVVKDDDQMDINDISLEKIYSGEVDLLAVDHAEASEDLGYVNSLRNANVTDAYEAQDHNLDGRAAAIQAANDEYAQKAALNASDYTDKISQRLARLNEVTHVDDIMKNAQAEQTAELIPGLGDFF